MNRYTYKDQPKYKFGDKYDFITGTFNLNGNSLCKVLFPMADEDFEQKYFEVYLTEIDGSFGMGNYSRMLEFENIKIYTRKKLYFDEVGNDWVYDEDCQQCYLFLSGQGIDTMQEFNGLAIYPEKVNTFLSLWLLELIQRYSFKPTRIDIALDDYVGVLPLDSLGKKVKNKQYISRIKSGYTHDSVSDNEFIDLPVGRTIYFGSRKNLLFRFYDKKAERMNKASGELIKFCLENERYFKKMENSIWKSQTHNEDWNNYLFQRNTKVYAIESRFEDIIFQRYEVEMRDKYALLFIDWLKDQEKWFKGFNIGEYAHSLIVSKVTFLQKGKNKDKRCWKVWRVWEDFSKGVQTVPSAPVRDVPDMYRSFYDYERKNYHIVGLFKQKFELMRDRIDNIKTDEEYQLDKQILDVSITYDFFVKWRRRISTSGLPEIYKREMWDMLHSMTIK